MQERAVNKMLGSYQDHCWRLKTVRMPAVPGAANFQYFAAWLTPVTGCRRRQLMRYVFYKAVVFENLCGG